MPHKLFCALIVPVISSFFLCGSAFPDLNIDPVDTTTTRIAAKFTRQGVRYYAQRNLPQALDYFSRALLLDPGNRTARENLLKINDRLDRADPQKIELYRVEDLFRFRDQARQKLAATTENRNRLVEVIIQRNGRTDFILQGLAGIEARFNIPEQNWRLNDNPKTPLEALISALITENGQLSYDLLCRQKQYLWLQKIQNMAHAISTIPSTAKVLPENRPELPFADPWGEITGLRDELASVKEQLERLHNDMDSKNQRIIDLTKEVIEFSLKLAEKEMTLTEKVNTLQSLHEAYADLQSRLTLGQKIIEEKNIQIQSLEESLASLQGEAVAKGKQVGAMLDSRDKELNAWEDILVIYQGKLKEATRKLEASNHDVAELHEELNTTRTQLFEKESALEKVKNKLAVLQTRLQPVQDQNR